MSKSDVNHASKPLVSTTVRISGEQHHAIEEMMRQMAMSKQKVLAFLLEEGLKVVKSNSQKEQDDAFSESSFYLFNLSKHENVSDETMMLTKQIIVAKDMYCQRLIRDIGAQRTVYFYSENKGVIAYGKTSGKTLQMGECVYQKLSNFQTLEYPVSVSAVRKILGINFISSNVITPLNDGHKIFEHINSVLHTCPKCGVQARGFNEIEKLFGFRNMPHKISHQSWCRMCRRG
ncbi:hypothetical protein [Vibrio viridaestus]|uniref:Uncharacterized protein n=1 Tax=Vibrio viridaestus TaxID=2487322 RepID=A0A3N9TBM9_9VIBR|nr:hypothetical protein [Vibrio viridaestus]RQW61113.1 hypothetical protein EES38_21210 [Vibrio viridaestus]